MSVHFAIKKRAEGSGAREIQGIRLGEIAVEAWIQDHHFGYQGPKACLVAHVVERWGTWSH